MLFKFRWGLFFSLTGLLISPFLVQSQETSTSSPTKNDVFAPFISRLKTKEGEYNVTLTWKDSEDLVGENLIYRHTEPISEVNLSKATLTARVPHGIELYYDYPPDTQSYFYAILIESTEAKKRFDLFIPFRNVTSVGVNIQSAGALETIVTKITDMKAASSLKGIYVTFNSSRPSRSVTIYRSNNPLDMVTDLSQAIFWELDKGASSYLDLPPAGLDYYYAAVDSELIKQEKIQLVKGENTTRYPAKIPFFSSEFNAYETQPLRPQPLPMLTLQKELESGHSLDNSNFYLPTEKKVKPATEKIITRFVTNLKKSESKPLTYTILNLEKLESKTEEDKNLKSIVQECLLTDLQQKAISRLTGFIKELKSKAVKTRAQFYLGQAYYFNKQYQAALMEILMAQDEYYVETAPWINRCFEQLQK